MMSLRRLGYNLKELAPGSGSSSGLHTALISLRCWCSYDQNTEPLPAADNALRALQSMSLKLSQTYNLDPSCSDPK